MLNNQDPNATYYPDNSWLKVAFELGVFALWFLVIWLVSMFLYTRESERRVSGIDQDFVAGVAAQLLAIMVGSLVATYLELVADGPALLDHDRDRRHDGPGPRGRACSQRSWYGFPPVTAGYLTRRPASAGGLRIAWARPVGWV